MALFNAQVSAAATTLTTLYTVPGATSAAVSSVVVCNRRSTPNTFRIAVRAIGASIADEHYLYYDQAIDGNSTFIATIGATLIATDVVSVYAGGLGLSFNLFGEVL